MKRSRPFPTHTERFTQRTPDGSTPVALNQRETRELRRMFLSTPSIKASHKYIKRQYLSTPFDVVINWKAGKDKGTRLNENIVKNVVKEYYMPFLNDVEDWLFQFGICPYYATLVPVWTDDEGEQEKQRSDGTGTTKKKKKKTKNYEKEEDEEEEEENDDESKKRQKKKRKITYEGNVGKSSSRPRVKFHQVYKVPTFGTGYISTYKDLMDVQRYSWTWYNGMIPSKRPGITGESYRDLDMQWVIKNPPEINGNHTSVLSVIYREYAYLDCRKRVSLVVMKGELNQNFALEKESKVNQPSKSISEIMETSSRDVDRFGFSSSYGGGGEELRGRMQNLSRDVTGTNALTDCGIEGWEHVTFPHQESNLNGIYKTMQFNAGLNAGGPSNRGLFEGRANVFGSILDDGVSADLYENNVDDSQHTIVNRMNGTGLKIHHLREGEKLTDLGRQNISSLLDADSILMQQEYLDKISSILIGYPLMELMTKQGQTHGSLSETTRNHALSELKGLKTFYAEFIERLWKSAYFDAFDEAFHQCQIALDPKDWHDIEHVLDIKVKFEIFRLNYSLEELRNLFRDGVITFKEFYVMQRDGDKDLRKSRLPTSSSSASAKAKKRSGGRREGGAADVDEDDGSEKSFDLTLKEGKNKLDMLLNPRVRMMVESDIEVEKQKALDELEVAKQQKLKDIELEYQKKIMQIQFDNQKKLQSQQQQQNTTSAKAGGKDKKSNASGGKGTAKPSVTPSSPSVNKPSSKSSSTSAGRSDDNNNGDTGNKRRTSATASNVTGNKSDTDGSISSSKKDTQVTKVLK